MNFQFSLRTLSFSFVYAAICCLVYMYENLWAGTLVVTATIILLVFATVSAFRHHNYFTLGFSVCAWAWMVFWLGFCAQTGPNSVPWTLPEKVAYVMRGFRDHPEVDSTEGYIDYGAMHSLLFTGFLAQKGNKVYVPNARNSIRLAVCLSALIFGFLGGGTTSLIVRKWH